MADVGEIKARLVLKSDEFKRGMDDARNEMNKTGASAKRTSKDIDLIHKAALGVGVAVATGFAASVGVAANFEQKMKDIQSVSGATGMEMEQLGDLAKEMGAKTAFSAGEAAAGIEELIKAGLTVEQVIGGGLEGALNLATAGGLQLAEAAEIASTALNSFKDDNLTVADAANVLAGAANASATDVREMKYGLSQVSAVAAGAGLSFQDTSTALATFAMNGLKGSDAGTSLKTMLQNLQPRTKEQIALFKELGLMTRDGQNAFYDLNGEIKGMDDIAGVLQTALKGMTDQQRAFALETIFGSDAVRAGNILYKEGAQGINEMWDAMSKVTAAEVAATKLDTLKGAFDELMGSLETVGIQVGEEFLPALTQVTRIATDVIRNLGEMDGANVKAAFAFAGTTAAVALTITTIGRLGFALKTLSKSMGPAGWVIAGLSLVAGAFAGVTTAQNEMEKVTLDNVIALDKERKTLSDNISAYDSLASKSKLTTDELARFVDINAEISKTADPNVIARLKDEQDKLREKSGLSNDELGRMVSLNGDILKVVPESNTVLTDQGNVLMKNTDKAKAFNAEQAKMVQLELEAKKAKLEANMKQYLTDEKNLLAQQRTLKIEMKDMDKEEIKIKGKIHEIEDKLVSAKESEKSHLNFKLGVENLKLQKLREQRGEIAGQVLDNQKAIDKVQAQIGKLDEVKRKMVDIQLQQVGINAKRGEEMATIDAEIVKLEQAKQKLQEKVPVSQRNTEEYRNAAGAIDSQIAKLNGAKAKVEEIIGRAAAMNSELGKSINKYVTVTTRNIEERIARDYRGSGGSPRENYHVGGIVGRGQLPQLHVGGLASQFAGASHNEIDVRLLRNEMVLTEAQQANLARMIDAGFTGNATGGSALSPAEVGDIKKLLGSIAANTAQAPQVAIDRNALWGFVDSRQASAAMMDNRNGGIKR
ncbi:phage tail tape measure protein [Mesobacillus zeae]